MTEHVERFNRDISYLEGRVINYRVGFTETFPEILRRFRAPTRPCNLTGADCASAIIIQTSDRDDIAVAALGVLKIFSRSARLVGSTTVALWSSDAQPSSLALPGIHCSQTQSVPCSGAVLRPIIKYKSDTAEVRS